MTVTVNFRDNEVKTDHQTYFDVGLLQSVMVTALPTKTVYYPGEVINLSGVVVAAGYDTGYELKDITSQCSFDPYNGYVVSQSFDGVIQVEVTYGGKVWDTFALTVTAQAVPVASGNGWTLYDDGTLVITGNVPDLETPEDALWWPYKDTITNIVVLPGVTELGDNAFSGLPNVISITLPDTITDIGAHVFDNLPSLTDVYIPDTVLETIPALGDLFPELVNFIIYNQDHGTITKLEITSLPAKLQYYVGDTMDYTGLVVTAYYGDGTQSDVTANCTLIPAEGEELLSESFGNVICDVFLGDPSAQIHAGQFTVRCEQLIIERIEITSLPDKTDYDYYTLPETLDLAGLNVTAIYNNGTWCNINDQIMTNPPAGQPLTGSSIRVLYSADGSTFTTGFQVSASIPPVQGSGDWWTVYGDGTLFVYCNGDMPNYGYHNPVDPHSYHAGPWSGHYRMIKKFVAGNSVTSIGSEIFSWPSYGSYDGYKIEYINTGNGVTRICEEAFTDAQHPDNDMRTLILGNNVQYIDSKAFCYGNSFDDYVPTHLVIGDKIADFSTLENVFPGGFWNMLESLDFGKGIESVPDNFLRNGCSLTSLKIHRGSIGSKAFYNCSLLESLTLATGVTSIGEGAFYWCDKLKNLIVPGSVDVIGDHAFYRCVELQTLVIEEGVTSIGNWAFTQCENLETLIIPRSVAKIGAGAFTYADKISSFTINRNCVYQREFTTTGWPSFPLNSTINYYE